MELNDIIAMLTARLDSVDSTQLENTSIKFDINGLGTIMLSDSHAREVAKDTRTDTTISIDKDDLENLLNGQLNPAMAFLGGRLRVSGNVGLAMKLQTVLEDKDDR